MPISSGPIGLTRMYHHSHVDGLQTWNQPGLHTNEGVSSLRSMDRPYGAGVARDVNVLFGHAQLIPTYTLQPAEEMKQQQWMDPSVAPAPREEQYAAQAQFLHARAASASYAGEGDTLNQLGLAARQTKWDGGVIKQADRTRPMSASVRGTRRTAAASPSRGGARSRSPSAGRHGLSKRPPLHLSSSALSLTSPTSPRAVKQLDAAAKRDVASGQFNSPNTKDLAQARRYVAQLDRELSENAQQAINDEKRSVLAASSAAAAGGITPRKEAEWNRDLMVGMHVRAVGMERKWAGPGQGADRIGALYASERDPNTSSTHILQQSLRNTVRESSQLYDPHVSADDMLNRSSVADGTLHSPRSGAGVNNTTYIRDREQQSDSMPDKHVDRGFWASGTRQHEEANGGKMLLKNRAWPRDPITAAAVGRAASHMGPNTESRNVHGVNTSTTSSRVRAQENGELNYDLSASFGPGGPASIARASQQSARGSNFQLANASQTGLTGGATPQQTPNSSRKKLRPAGSNAKEQQQQASRNALSPLPYSTSTLPPHSVTREQGHYSNPHNTSAAAQLNNSVTAASAHAQSLHAQKFDPRTGGLRSRHPRDFADDYLANAHGISVASGMGGVPEDSSYGSGLNDSRNLTGASLVAPSQQGQHNIEGNGAILDLSSALASRSKAPWKYGGARGTRKHDRKLPSDEDRVLEEARKKRLPSTQRGAGAPVSSGRRRPHSAGASFRGSDGGGHTHSHSVAHAHRSGHSLSGGKAGFVTTPMSLKPSLHLSQSGRNILGRTRVTQRVDLTDQDWEYMRAKDKAAKKAAYERSQRGPHDPPPHNTSVIEEAMHLEKLARRERSMVAREREWRAQQIWLHEKKKGMDKLAARAKAATRTMPPRPARPEPPADDLDVSAAGGGLAKVWSGGPLIAPTYLDSLGRVTRDIDDAAEVRGKDRLAAHAKQQIAAANPKRGDLTLPYHPSSHDQSLEEDWPSKHQLSSELTNPLLEESKQQHSRLSNDSPDDPAARRPGEYELDELELEAQRRRAGLPSSNAARDRAQLDAEERKEMQDLYDQAQQIAATQDWRERAAERALSGSKSATSNSAPKDDPRGVAAAQEQTRWAQERDAEERAQALSRFNAAPASSSSYPQLQQQPRRSPSNTASTRHPASLNFTSSPHKIDPRRGDDGGLVTGGANEGSRALQAAALYDQRLREMIAFLRVRHPYWSDAERHDRANERARWLVAQELARMGPDGGQVPPIPSQSSKPDWFSEYQLLRAAQEVPPVAVQRQTIEAMSPSRPSQQQQQQQQQYDSSDLPEFARSGVRSHNPFAPQAHLPNRLDDAAQLEEMRRKSAEITARYERMRAQAMEAQKR